MKQKIYKRVAMRSNPAEIFLILSGTRNFMPEAYFHNLVSEKLARVKMVKENGRGSNKHWLRGNMVFRIIYSLHFNLYIGYTFKWLLASINVVGYFKCYKEMIRKQLRCINEATKL